MGLILWLLLGVLLLGGDCSIHIIWNGYDVYGVFIIEIEFIYVHALFSSRLN